MKTTFCVKLCCDSLIKRFLFLLFLCCWFCGQKAFGIYYANLVAATPPSRGTILGIVAEVWIIWSFSASRQSVKRYILGEAYCCNRD